MANGGWIDMGDEGFIAVAHVVFVAPLDGGGARVACVGGARDAEFYFHSPTAYADIRRLLGLSTPTPHQEEP